MASAARKLTLPLAILWLALGFTLIIFYQRGVFQQESDLPAFPYGELRIAVDASYAPFATYAGESLQGIDIDLGLALGEQLGLPVRFVTMNIDGLYDSLINDQADIIISALVVDTWKTREVRYTDPYFDAGLVIISLHSSSISRMDDLPGHTLAYEFGSTANSEASKWLRRIESFDSQAYELPQYALDAVRLGIADAALVDAVDAHLYLRQNPQWQAGVHYVTHIHYVIAIRIDKTSTYISINDTLASLAKMGIIEEIIEKWLS